MWFWLLGLLVAWRVTHAKPVSTVFGDNTIWLLGLLVAWWTLLPLVGVGWFGLLGLSLLGFGESTYTDGWIMDREKNVPFWCVGWLVGWLACR